MKQKNIDEILADLADCNPVQRREIFSKLRTEFPIHPLEAAFGVPAEVILEAIHRATDLTQRGVRGVIAEAQFGTTVANVLPDWQTSPIIGDQAYDFSMNDSIGAVRVQVKNQRKSKGAALEHHGFYVVETQRTRSGTDADGDGTRLYRFNEFDIIAACMQPSTGNWADFMYSVGRWLIPKVKDETRLNVFQYIPKRANDEWTSNFLEAVDWHRSGVIKTISRPVSAKEQSKTKFAASLFSNTNDHT